LFGISFATIVLTLAISSILVVCIFAAKNQKFIKICLVFLLASSIAFNALLIQEYVFHFQGTNPSQATYDLVDYFEESNLNYPVYSNDEGVLFYINNSYWLSNKQQSNVMGLDDYEQDYEDVIETIVRLKKTNGTVLVLNWPPIPEKSPTWDVVVNCDLEKTFYSKDYKIAMVYSC